MNKKTNKSSVFMIISFAFLALYAISLLTPLLWSIMTSFKGSEFDNDNFGWPTEFVNNYKDIFTTFKAAIPNPNGGSSLHVNVMGMIFNSLWYAIGSAIISTTVAYMVAYVVARFNFKFCNVIYTIIILQKRRNYSTFPCFLVYINIEETTTPEEHYEKQTFMECHFNHLPLYGL